MLPCDGNEEGERPKMSDKKLVERKSAADKGGNSDLNPVAWSSPDAGLCLNEDIAVVVETLKTWGHEKAKKSSFILKTTSAVLMK